MIYAVKLRHPELRRTVNHPAMIRSDREAGAGARPANSSRGEGGENAILLGVIVLQCSLAYEGEPG